MTQLAETSPSAEHAEAARCWICGGARLRLVKPSNLPEGLHPDALRITDANYGLTADIFRCESCGFLQCPNVPPVLELYEKMSDDSYEDTRAARARQARALMNIISRHKKAARLLDVGAGSGILVEEALASGFAARGIEPSSPLQAIAAQRGLPVTHGVLPNSELPGPFDVVTLIDVIEHVPDPVDLVRRIKSVMAPDGIFVVVTPDVELGCGAFDGVEMVAFSRRSHRLLQQVHAWPGVGDGGATRQRDHAAVVAPAFELPGEEGVQLPSPAVSAASSTNSGSDCCSNQFV